MRAFSCFLLTLTILALASGCGGPAGPGPILLYGGPPLPSSEIAVIRVVKTHPKRGHPTLNIRKVTRMGDSAVVVFQAQEGRGWAVPSHFGGLPDPGQRSSRVNSKGLPDQFEVPPGSYQIEFLYVQAVDHLGWTHKRTTTDLTWLICRPGSTYSLEGGLMEDGEGWLLTVTENPTGGAETPPAS